MRQDLAGIWAAASEQLLTYPLAQPVRLALLAATYGGLEPSQVCGLQRQTSPVAAQSVPLVPEPCKGRAHIPDDLLVLLISEPEPEQSCVIHGLPCCAVLMRSYHI